MLRIRLKMLVAFPIFSGEMCDMASDISGMNRKASATPCRTCAQKISQNPAFRLSPESWNIVTEPRTMPTPSNRRGSVFVVRCPANGVNSSAPIPRGDSARPELYAGYPMSVCKYSGSKTRLAYSTKPSMLIRNTPALNDRSRSTRRSTTG